MITLLNRLMRISYLSGFNLMNTRNISGVVKRCLNPKNKRIVFGVRTAKLPDVGTGSGCTPSMSGLFDNKLK